MKNVAAAIDFGTSKIVTLLAESGGFNRCDIIGSGTVPYSGYIKGHWNDDADKLHEAVRNSINAAEIQGKAHIREIYVGVPCEYISIVSTEATVPVEAQDRRVQDTDIAAVEDAAADLLKLSSMDAMVIHRSPAWFKVDDGKKTMSPVGVKGSTLSAKVAFVLADPAFIMDVSSMFMEMGIAVMGFLAPTMGESLLLLSLDDRDRVSVLIDCGYLNTEFSVVEGDAIVYHMVLPVGGADITVDLCTALQIPMSAAEQIKREYIFIPDEFDPAEDAQVVDDEGRTLTFPRQFVQEAIERSADELIEQIEWTMDKCKGLLTERSQVFITGGGLAMMRGGREYLAGKLHRPVKVSMVRSAKLDSPVYASALGLVDLVFDSIEQRTAQEESLPGRLADGIRSIFSKK